jgi:hypothetical protein
VQQISVGELGLYARSEEACLAALRPLGLDGLVADKFARGPVLTRDRNTSGRYLPRSRRQHGYAAVMAMAANYGIRVRINALTNPDFNAGPGLPGSRPRIPTRALASR